MTTDALGPPRQFDLPPGRLETRKRHLLAEIPGVHQRRRTTVGLALAPVAAIGATLVLLLVAPWQSRGPSVVDRALAAVGAGPVVHAVVEYSWPQDVVVDLATGAERERVHRAEYWFDEQRGRLRASYTTDGSQPIEYVQPAGVSELDPALGGFVTQYSEALASGRAHVVGDVTVDGRPAKRIEFAPRIGGAVEEVTVDATTFAPLSFHASYPPGRRSPEWRVRAIASIPRDAADFSVALPSKPVNTHGEVSAGREISLAAAERALGARPLWLGPSFAGHVLDSVELEHASAWLTDGTRPRGLVVRIGYDSVRIGLARDRGGRYALGFGLDEYPTPPRGSIAVTGNDLEGWQGSARHGDFAVTVSAPSKATLLIAARALAPVQ